MNILEQLAFDRQLAAAQRALAQPVAAEAAAPPTEPQSTDDAWWTEERTRAVLKSRGMWRPGRDSTRPYGARRSDAEYDDLKPGSDTGSW